MRQDFESGRLIMADIFDEAAGSQMLLLKQEIAELRKRLAELTDEQARQAVRRTLLEKETHYNILADRKRLQH